MGDVRVPALATVVAAFVAVSGSIFAVWLSGRQQRRLQANAFADRAAARRTQSAEERARAARSAEVDDCARFDATVALALATLLRMADLAGRPGVRRRLLGRNWARQWYRDLFDAGTGIALPLSAARLTTRPAVRAAVDAVASALDEAATAVGSLPTRVPELLLVGPVISRWRDRVAAATSGVQQARREMARVLEQEGERNAG